MPWPPVEQRFWAKVEIAPSGCWLWRGATQKGYGALGLRKLGRVVRAHRWAYEMFGAGQIPLGAKIDHTCRVTACVNPMHMEPVSHAENVRRGAVSATNGLREFCKSGRHKLAGNLYTSPAGYSECKTCKDERYVKRLSRR